METHFGCGCGCIIFWSLFSQHENEKKATSIQFPSFIRHQGVKFKTFLYHSIFILLSGFHILCQRQPQSGLCVNCLRFSCYIAGAITCVWRGRKQGQQRIKTLTQNTRILKDLSRCQLSNKLVGSFIYSLVDDHSTWASSLVYLVCEYEEFSFKEFLAITSRCVMNFLYMMPNNPMCCAEVSFFYYEPIFFLQQVAKSDPLADSTIIISLFSNSQLIFT